MLIPLTFENGGLAVSGVNVDDPMGDAYLVAHDIVEHVNGFDKIGGLEDEIEALGALWVVRGHSCDIRRPNRSMYSPERTISSELEDLAQMYWSGRPLRFVYSHAHYMDESFDCILDIFKEQAREISVEKREKFAYAALRLMRSGARKLCRKFSRFNRAFPEYAANQLFYSIVEAIPDMRTLDQWDEEYFLQIKGLDAKFIRKEIRYE